MVEFLESFQDNLLDGVSKTTYTKRDKKEMSHFTPFMQDIVKEVRNLPQQRRTKFYKKLAQVSAIVLPLVATKNAYAQEMPTMTSPFVPSFLQRQTQVPAYADQQQMIQTSASIVDQVKGLDILPPEIVDILIKLVIACGILGILLAMICLVASGALRMIGQREKASSLTRDTIKGLGQVLLAPVIVIILVTITSLALGGIDGLNLFY